MVMQFSKGEAKEIVGTIYETRKPKLQDMICRLLLGTPEDDLVKNTSQQAKTTFI